MVYTYKCNAMRKGSSFLPYSSVQLSARAESRVYVCGEELSSSSTLALGEGEEGDKVAYLALGLQGPTLISPVLLLHSWTKLSLCHLL